MSTQVKWIEKSFQFKVSSDQTEILCLQLKQNPLTIKDLTQYLSEADLIKKIEGKWSIKEHIGHLIDLEALHTTRLHEFSKKLNVLTPADMTNAKTHSAKHNLKELNELIAEFISDRQQFLNIVNSFSKDILNHTALHERLNVYMKPVDMLHFVNEHDKHHLESIKHIINSLKQ